MLKKFFLANLLIMFFALSSQLLNAEVDLRRTPWLTEEAINFLENFLLSKPDAKILEFGAGSSTIWFSRKTKNLVSVEHNPDWFARINQILLLSDASSEVDLRLIPRPYYKICEEFPDDFFDLVLVDGRNRNGCILHATRLIKSGGVLMLDNAERHYYKKGLALLKDWKEHRSLQTCPDSEGFFYHGWRTDWFIKP
jgi:predicted O-methyltransferase YrrM